MSKPPDSPPPERLHGSGPILTLAAILVANFALRWPFRSVPFIRDEGEYMHLGQEILRGAVPYLDIYNQKTPFAFYLVAGVQSLVGHSVEGIRIATTLWGTATAALVFVLARALFGPVAALFAAAAFCLMSFDQCGIVHASSTEYFMLLWLAAGAACWCAGRPRERRGAALLAGICAGLAYQTKQVGAVLPLFFAAEAAWRVVTGERDRASLRASARALGLAGIGFAAVLGATLLFFATQGALGAYVEATWTNNLEYVARRHRDPLGVLGLLVAVLRRVARWDLGLWLLGAGALAASAWRTPRSPGGRFWLLLAATLAAGLATGGVYVHYYEPTLVPFAVGVGAACAWLARKASTAGGTARRLAAAALLVAPWLAPAHHVVTSLADVEGSIAAYAARLPPLAEAPVAAAHLERVTRPGEPILVIGSEPQIYFYADRPSSSPMSHMYLLTGPYSFAAEKRERFLAELAERGPRYVVFVPLSTSLSEYPAAAARFEAQVRAVLDAHYDFERGFPPSTTGPAPHAQAYLQVFRRRESDAGAAPSPAGAAW